MAELEDSLHVQRLIAGEMLTKASPVVSMTTEERTASLSAANGVLPPTGKLVYDTDTSVPYVFNGTAWVLLDAAASVAAASAQSTANTAVSNAATAQSAAEAAQSTADNAHSDAATAQSTADNAHSDAATAQSTADACTPSIDAAPATTGDPITLDFVKNAITITPTGNCHFHNTNVTGGKYTTLIVTTSGTTSRELTFDATYFDKSTGTWDTGTVSGVVTCFLFVGNNNSKAALVVAPAPR